MWTDALAPAIPSIPPSNKQTNQTGVADVLQNSTRARMAEYFSGRVYEVRTMSIRAKAIHPCHGYLWTDASL